MKFQGMLLNTVARVIDMVPDKKLNKTLTESFTESGDSVQKIERCFSWLPEKQWSDPLLVTFFHSWKASHLKMLAIYGLSCRLQRLALSSEGDIREQLFIAAARNGETSHEDLGLDYDGETHAELYDRFAASFLKDSFWQLEKYGLPEALDFKRWIYRNMVVSDITQGLLTNIFSEIYNHGEYSMALKAFSAFIDNHYDFSPEKKRNALLYINVHVEEETEVDHFLVVVEALSRYHKALAREIDYDLARSLFSEYLNRLGSIMESLTQQMIKEQKAASNVISSHA